MATFRILVCLIIVSMAVVGCQSNSNSADSDSASASAGPGRLTMEKVREVRAVYEAADPNARVGYVNATLPDNELVSLTDVPVSDFRPGDAISFIDANQQVIANGRVVNVVDDAVHVKYNASTRAPAVGDLGVKFVQ